MAPGDSTDDVGQFRLHGLSPGDYFVSAAMGGGMMFGQSEDRIGYGTTYYPSTAVQSEAQRVSVSVGQETQQINITMTPIRIATISGTAVSSTGKPVTRGMLMLTQGTAGGFSSMGAPLKADGSFVFSNVVPGDYRVQVQHVPDGDMPVIGSSMPGSEIGSVAVTVAGQDVTGLSIVTSPGGSASGRIVFEGGARPSTPPAALNVSAVPVELTPMLVGGGFRVRDDWTFEASGLTERRRFRVNTPPGGWYLKAVTHDATDVTDTGLDFKEGTKIGDIEIVLTQRATQLSGSVQDSRARPVTDYVVVVFADDSSRWGFQTRHVRAVRPNQEGKFSAKGMPPGDYYVVALDYLESGEESDPEQLEKWKGLGTRVTLAEGQPQARTLTVKPNR